MSIVIFVSLVLAIVSAEDYVTTTTLNVRDGPCTSFKILRSLPTGTTVKSAGNIQSGCGHDWIPITSGGFVALKFLSKVNPPTPSGPSKNILLIGDSHTCGTFGQTLDSHLRSRFGASSVATFGRAGMRVSSFLFGTQTTKWGWIDFLPNGQRLSGSSEKVTPKLQNLLFQYSPKLTIVALGANEISGASRDHISTLLGQIKQAKSACAWVLPPQTRCDNTKCPYSPKSLKAYYDIVTPLLVQNSCTVIKSDPATLPFLDFNKLMVDARNQGDAIHYDSLGSVGREAARKWAQHAFQAISL